MHAITSDFLNKRFTLKNDVCHLFQRFLRTAGVCWCCVLSILFIRLIFLLRKVGARIMERRCLE